MSVNGGLAKDSDSKNQVLIQKATYFVEDKTVNTAIVAGVAILTGGGAFLFAPALAAFVGGLGVLGMASTGVAINSLSGAALISASLAKLGFGTLAAGGLGMAGGTGVITVTGAAIGAKITAIITGNLDEVNEEVTSSKGGFLYVSRANFEKNEDFLALFNTNNEVLDDSDEDTAISTTPADDTSDSKGMLYVSLNSEKGLQYYHSLLGIHNSSLDDSGE